MKNNYFLWLCISFYLMVSCNDNSFSDDSLNPVAPYNIKYVEILGGRETKYLEIPVPTIQTGGLLPSFELISIRNAEGTVLDESYLQHVSIGGVVPFEYQIDEELVKLDENGDPLTSISAVDVSKNGAITIAAGNNFTAGDYYFTIKVTTEKDGVQYATTFDNAFHLNIGPLLPSRIVYSPKNQNLVFGDSDSKTSKPIIPGSNPEVRFELDNAGNSLVIDGDTGIISISPEYNYTGQETIHPIIKIISKISEEVVVFEDALVVVISDLPIDLPLETFYIFYPTLLTSGSYPSGGDGFAVQVDIPGIGEDIWGEVDNSTGRTLIAPIDRPEGNTAQTVLETQTIRGSNTEPTSSWMVTTTQDLTPFDIGFGLSFNYIYNPAFQTYLPDGRTPTDLEVYISSDYVGGDIQDVDGNWLNGTWTQVNQSMKCNRSNDNGATWESEFIGTPYPGTQSGLDPDGRKNPGTTFYGKWVKCSYDIPADMFSTNVTVAFKVASYFEGVLSNNASAPGRGGIFFLSDFNYKAVETP